MFFEKALRRNRRSLLPGKGVTLLEMIVVFMIVAIGAALVFPQMAKTSDQKRADSAINTLRTISECIKEYKIHHGGALPAGAKYALLETTGCLDRNVFEKSFLFPASEDVITRDIKAVDVKGRRMVCLKLAGEVDTLKLWAAGAQAGDGYFLDFDGDGECDPNRSDRLRMILENANLNYDRDLT